MLSIRSDRLVRRAAAPASRTAAAAPPALKLLLLTGLLVVSARVAPLSAQEPASILSTEYSISGSEAALRLELADGRVLDMAIRRGGVYIDGARIGEASRGSDLDRSWRDLLNRAMDASPEELPQVLGDWQVADGPGARMAGALDAALEGTTTAGTATTAQAVPAPIADSMARLHDRLAELQSQVEQFESTRRATIERPSRRANPFRYITEGIAGLFSTAIAYAVIFGIGFLIIMFGGRRYIEGVADTARNATGRSFLVGLAATFLIVPAFALGAIALAISIIGIPALLVWIPGFPVAVMGAVVLGYISVAHALGESFAERRFHFTDWFQRGNSYYFLLSGLGILLALFFASQVVHMAGPWLRAINAILISFGVFGTVIAAFVGFGAVLISRAGKQPFRRDGALEPEPFTEDAGV